jgi:serine/threonine protein kinase
MEAPVASEMFGPYRLESLLGQGGMGRVFRAFDTEMDRPVALKVLNTELSGDPEYRDRFRREAKVASQLTDPHVVPIHRHGEIDGQLFLDMRLVDGEDLFQVLRDSGPLDVDAAVRVVEQVASALDAAHEAGLVHRDVKPANVFLTRRDRFAYLGDFGIARQTAGGSLTATGATVGTLDYMAPERFRGLEVDGRADVYALGCLLHETLTARKPFPETEPAALMGAHLTAGPPRPSEYAAVPAGLDAVVARGMAKEPADRHRSAGALAAEARAVLAQVGAPTAGLDLADRAAPSAGRPVPAGSHPAGPPAPAASWPPGPVPSSPEPHGNAASGHSASGSGAPDRGAPRAVPTPVPPAAGDGEQPLRWDVPGGSAQVLEWLVAPGESYPAEAELVVLRLPDGTPWRLADDRAGTLAAAHAAPGAVIGSGDVLGSARRPGGRRAPVKLAAGLVLGALAHLLVLNNIGFETGLLFWQLSGTVFGTLAACNLRPRSWGSGRTTTLVVVALPVVFTAVFLTGLALGLVGSGSAILVATMLVYTLWAATLYRRRTAH